jgi:Ca-activated chloride channel family protein
MSTEKTDPRLTAYAFGELTGDEKLAFEAELAGSELARRELADIERTVAAVRGELKRGTGPTLDEARRQRIELAAQSAAKPRRARRRLVVGLWSTVAMAAGAALFVEFAVPKFRLAEPKASAPLNEAVPFLATATVQPAIAASAAPGPVSDPNAPGFDRAAYDHFDDNPFVSVASDARSTFSIDVDTASYALVRRHLMVEGRLPPKGAVRIEELVNYFDYSYPEPPSDRPFSVQTDVTAAPWAPDHRLMRVAIKGKHLQPASLSGANLVFLLDVSGSMSPPDRLPLIKNALSMLAEQLDRRTKVSIVVYAGASGLVLPPTSGADKRAILGALDRLQAGGSTNGGQGIQLAYSIALQNFVKGGVNRVILATDGDFNVGVTSQSDLVDLVQERAKGGVFLTVLGVGNDNFNDSMLEKLADKGNGNYAYIDSLSEGRKVLVEQATGTLVTIAKDVKIQIEFNPREVESFRLIGYENRVMAHRDFKDDKKDAGEIGADHRVTALYEVVPVGAATTEDDALKYQKPGALSTAAGSGELCNVKLRYKLPDGDDSLLIETPVRDGRDGLVGDFRFAASVAEFGMLLRDSPHKGNSTYDQVLALASSAASDDRKREFVDMVRKAKLLGEPPR